MANVWCVSVPRWCQSVMNEDVGAVRESSFNMTRGGDEDIEGGLRKFFDTRRGGSEKNVTLGGGGSENLYT